MSLVFWKKVTVEPSEADKGPMPVTDQHPLPAAFYFLPEDATEYTEVTSAKPLPVDIAATNGPGRMQVWDITVPGISASAYTAADAVGQMIIFPSAARLINGKGSIVSASIVDLTDQGAAMNLVLFNGIFTATADNATMAVSDADARSAVGGLVWATTDYVDFGGFRVATIRNQWIGYTCKDGNLYGQFMTSGTPTYAIGDLRLILVALWD